MVQVVGMDSVCVGKEEGVARLRNKNRPRLKSRNSERNSCWFNE